MISPNLTTQRVACLRPPQADLSMVFTKSQIKNPKLIISCALAPLRDKFFISVNQWLNFFPLCLCAYVPSLSILPIFMSKYNTLLNTANLHTLKNFNTRDCILEKYSLRSIHFLKTLENSYTKSQFPKNQHRKITRETALLINFNRKKIIYNKINMCTTAVSAVPTNCLTYCQKKDYKYSTSEATEVSEITNTDFYCI